MKDGDTAQGTLTSIWLAGVIDGLCVAWRAGQLGEVADTIVNMRQGLGLLALGGLLARLDEDDRIELGALLSRRVLFPAAPVAAP